MQVPLAHGHNFMFRVKILSAPLASVAMTVKVIFVSDVTTSSNVGLQVRSPVTEIANDPFKGKNW